MGPWPTVLAPGNSLDPSYTPAGLVMPGLPGLYPSLSELIPAMPSFLERIQPQKVSGPEDICTFSGKLMEEGKAEGPLFGGWLFARGKRLSGRQTLLWIKEHALPTMSYPLPPYLNFNLGWRAAHSPSSLQHSPGRRKCGCHAWRRSVAVVVP